MNKMILLIFVIIFSAVVSAQPSEVTVSIQTTMNSGESSDEYACLQDKLIDKVPVLGLVFYGRALVNVDYSVNTIEMTQDFYGNKFLIPVTTSGCSTMKNKPTLSYLAAFVPMKILTTITLDYPTIDIIGEFSRNGFFSLLLKKTGEDQVSIGVK